jgi:two-component system cell cycle response regulator DivK
MQEPHPSGEFHSGQLATIRDEARVLVQRAGNHEADLGAFVAAAETSVRAAEAALLDAPDATHLQVLLSTQLQQTKDGAETARRLYAGAYEQRVAAGLLLTHLDRDLSAEQRFCRDGVLVVDDSGGIREEIAEVLRSAGFVVRTAANGLEGLLAAYEMRPVVIVMDMTMPVLNGIEATRLIKAAEATRQARIIAYTGEPSLRDSPVQKMFAAVVEKPATPAVLLATVQRVASL